MTSNPIAEHKIPMTPKSAQILFIDIQPEIVGNSKTNSADDVVKSAVALAKLGKLFGLPMHASIVPVGDKPRLVPELEAELEGVTPLVRTNVNVFDDPATAKAIEACGRHDLVVCGVVTEVAVLLAAFKAVVLGHEVHVPVDACGGISSRTEDAAFRRIESFGAATASVATLAAVLSPDLATEQGQLMMGILMSIMQ